MLLKIDRKVNLPMIVLNHVNDVPGDLEEVTVIGFGSTQARVDVNNTSDKTTYIINNEVEEVMDVVDDDLLTPRIKTLQKVNFQEKFFFFYYVQYFIHAEGNLQREKQRASCNVPWLPFCFVTHIDELGNHHLVLSQMLHLSKRI